MLSSTNFVLGALFLSPLFNEEKKQYINLVLFIGRADAWKEAGHEKKLELKGWLVLLIGFIG